MCLQSAIPLKVQPQPNLSGLVFNPRLDPDRAWMAAVMVVPVGHVSETGWQEIDADGILAALRQAVAQSNSLKRTCKLPTAEIVGWNQPPQYDPASHRLSWILNTRVGDEPEQTESRTTLIFGRTGFVEIDTISYPRFRDTARQAAAALSDSFSFTAGHRYEDFSAATARIGQIIDDALTAIEDHPPA